MLFAMMDTNHNVSIRPLHADYRSKGVYRGFDKNYVR